MRAQTTPRGRIGGARRWLRLLCVASAATVVSACMRVGFLTVNAAASFSDFSALTNVAYGSLPANRLDIYLPAHAVHSPIVVFFFGGGWKSGDKSLYKFVGAALAASGIIAVIPNYTLYPKARFPAFMHDAARAVAWTRVHAREWGGDPERLYLVGHSSGAYIAAMLALDQEYLQQVGGSTKWLCGVVGLAGPYNFLPFNEEYLKDLFGPAADFARSQPINYVRAGAPPLLLMQGLDDKMVSPSNTRSLAAALRKVGGRVKIVYFKRAGHAELVAAFSILERKRLPVLEEIRAFIMDTNATSPVRPRLQEWIGRPRLQVPLSRMRGSPSG